MFDRDRAGNQSDIKRRLSDRLLPLDFVSGVGGESSKLKIYLARELQPAEHQKVQKILDAEAPGTNVEFVASGPFKAQ